MPAAACQLPESVRVQERQIAAFPIVFFSSSREILPVPIAVSSYLALVRGLNDNRPSLPEICE